MEARIANFRPRPQRSAAVKLRAQRAIAGEEEFERVIELVEQRVELAALERGQPGDVLPSRYRRDDRSVPEALRR
jgi:hypothetical protein